MATDAHHHGAHDAARGTAGTHAGHHAEQFRRRFWWSLLLTVPVVATSEMVMDWFNYELDFAGMELVGPVLAHPSEEGVAGRLHQPLPVDDPVALVAVRRAARQPLQHRGLRLP